MALEKEDINSITEALVTALNANRDVENIRHKEDHDFMYLLRKREERKQELWEAVKIHLAKWGSVGLITGLLAAIWLYAKQHLIVAGSA